jgi:LPS export ABC transporter protein LptC
MTLGPRGALVPLALTLVLLAGCASKTRNPATTRATPFVFQALNLRQQDAKGRLLWRVKSPEARYDLSRHLAQARQLRGEIHSNGQLLYLLQATHGTVVNDGQVIQLEGDVRIQRLGVDPVTIRAARMRWYPSQQRIELDRKAEAANPQLLLQADRATLLLAEDRLQLRGQPQLQRRQQGASRASTWSLRVRDLDWSPGNGRLEARGPVVATDPNPKGAPSTLQARGLTGNSIERRLVLHAPVRLAVPERQAWLQGQQTTIDLNSNSVRSALAFQAAVGGLQISGQGFDLAFDQQVVTLPRGCQLLQRDASLEAGSCRWNWQSERIQADGGVVLKRKVPQQTTQAKRLSGRLGADGLVVLSAPGAKVRSSLRLPPPSASVASPGPAIRP